jgi:phosphoadenosine phosphosulfate reductase
VIELNSYEQRIHKNTNIKLLNHRPRKDYQPIVEMQTYIDNSILICKEFQNRDPERITILAFSGGKDSLATYLVMALSGIKFKAVYSPTSVDPPELIYYIKYSFNPWAESKGYPAIEIVKYNKFTKNRAKGKMEGKEITMMSLLSNRALPPTRRMRYCCSELKERTGEIGDTVFTGVRNAESKGRKERKVVEFFEGKIMIRPILPWTDVQVWSFILSQEAPYCILYDYGFDRLGCIGCPLGSNQKREFQIYPMFKQIYLNCFRNMLEYRKENNMETEWETPEDVMKWFVGESDKKREEIEGQCSMF